MDSLEYFNSISEQDYKRALSNSLEATFKSITFSYYNILKIFSKASKKCVLNILDATPNFDKSEIPVFESLMSLVTKYSKDVEIMGKAIFDN